MKRLIVIVFALLCIVLCVSSCGEDEYDKNYKYDGEALVGKWREAEYKDYQYQVYEFFENGNVTCTEYSFGIESGRIDATYYVEGDNTLVINWKSNQTDRNNFSISKNNVLFITQVASSSSSQMKLVPYDLTYNESNEVLLGSWASNDDPNEIFTFNIDYTGNVSSSDSYDFIYSTKDSYVFMCFEFVSGSPHIERMSYKVEGDTLTLTGQGEGEQEIILTFTRKK